MKIGEGLRAAVSMTLVASAMMLVIGAVGRDWSVAPLAGLVVVPHALLGLTMYAIVRQRGEPGARLTIIMGVLIGAIPVALLTFASPASSEMVDGVDLIVDGHRSAAGWLSWLKIVVICAGCGATAALAFWAVMQATRITAAAWATTLIAIVFTGALAAIPALTRDRTCHNVFRNGGTSIGSEANVQLSADESEWPTVIAEFAAFRRDWHWSLRTNVSPPSTFYRQLDVSVCTETGTALTAQAIKSTNKIIPQQIVTISILQPQGGISWREPAAALIRRIELRWPGRVRFKAGNGTPVVRPVWLDAFDENAGDARGNRR